MQAKLSKVLLYATNARIDPDKTKGVDPVLDTMWRQLDPDAKAIYRRVRDFYADNYALYRSLLNKAVDDSGAEGTVDDIIVTAGGVQAVLGFDFLQYFDDISGDDIRNLDQLTFSADGLNLQYDFDFSDYTGSDTPTPEFINALLKDVVEYMQANTDGKGVRFVDEFDGKKGLFAVWNTIRPEDVGAFKFDNESIDTEFLFSDVGSRSSTAKFELETEFTGVTIHSIDVTASAESAVISRPPLLGG
jgi:hypothetical protein